jgi:hypothetical protein
LEARDIAKRERGLSPGSFIYRMCENGFRLAPRGFDIAAAGPETGQKQPCTFIARIKTQYQIKRLRGTR